MRWSWLLMLLFLLVSARGGILLLTWVKVEMSKLTLLSLRV